MLLRTSAVYMLANGISAIIGFALVMIVTRLIGPGEYGLFVVANSLCYILVALMFTWLRQSLLRFESEGGATDLRLTALAGYAATLVVLPIVLWLLLAVGKVPVALAFAALAYSAAVALFELTQEIARARQRPWRFLAAVAVRSTLVISLAVTAIHLGYGGIGLIVAAAVGHFLAVLILSPKTLERPLKPIDRAQLKAFAVFGAPITFAGVFYAIHAGLDRLLVASALGAEAAGQYGAAADLVRQAINLPAIAASAAIAPMAVHTLKHEGAEAARQHLSDGLVLLFAIVGASAVGLACLAPDAAALAFGEAYRPAARVLIPPLALAWFGHALAQHYVHLSFNLANRSSFYIWMGAATLASGFAFIPIGLKVWGLIGGAVGLLLSEWLGIAVGVALSRRAHPLPLPFMALVRVALALVVMVGVIFAMRTILPPPSALTAVVLALLGGGAYVSMLLALDVLGVRRLLAQRLSRKAATHAA